MDTVRAPLNVNLVVAFAFAFAFALATLTSTAVMLATARQLRTWLSSADHLHWRCAHESVGASKVPSASKRTSRQLFRVPQRTHTFGRVDVSMSIGEGQCNGVREARGGGGRMALGRTSHPSARQPKWFRYLFHIHSVPFIQANVSDIESGVRTRRCCCCWRRPPRCC